MNVDSSDAAVIGGGVVGLSVARELRRAGVERVCVFEKEGSLGRGSSSRANGGVRAQFTTEINIAFSMYSIGEIERLRNAFEGELSFHQVGYLLFTADRERAEGLERATELQRSLGMETEWLSPEEIVDRAAFVRVEGLIGGTYHARDGYLDPHGLITVFEQEATGLGVEIRTGSEVGSIERASHEFELTVGEQRHRATWVVNAAGAHARTVASLLQVDVPVEPVRRNLAYLHDTDAPKEPLPMCVDLDTGVLVRREGPDGYVIAYSDPNDPPGWETALDPRFLPAVASRIGNRFPHLEGKRIHPKHCWAGLYPETPDGHAIVDEAPSVPGFIQCVGFGGHGLMHSPAAGKAVAELITKGRCDTFDLRPLRASRFDEGDLVLETAILRAGGPSVRSKFLGEVSNWGASVRPRADDGSLARERAGPSEGGAMRYLLLIYGPEWDSTGMTPEQQQASMDEWTGYTADLMKRGAMEGGEALEPTNTATTVRVRNDETLTTDGPFAETNEVLGGFYLINCKNLDEAIEIAAACPAAGAGSIELRPITEFGDEYQKAVRERAGIASS